MFNRSYVYLRICCPLWCFFLLLQLGRAQRTVGGTLFNDLGLPMKGVHVLDLESNRFVLTDTQGRFQIDLHLPARLQFSHTGFATKIYEIIDSLEIQVYLQAGIDLQEVIVTALGVERKVESVAFAHQVFDGTQILRALPPSLPQALSGRLAGMVFSQSSAGLGASARIVLRGNRSLVGNNQPLFVVDGIPISNFSSNPASALGGFDYGDGISNLNLEDIESINVLKGPSAAALYGSRANNGAILITTQKGEAIDKISIQLNSTFQFESPYLLRSLQNQFGQGNGGVYNRRGEQNWGPPMDGREVPHWSLIDPDRQYQFWAQPGNYLDFYRTGSNWMNTLKVIGGSDKMQSYFSYSFNDVKGIVPTSTLQSHQITYRGTLQINKKLHFDGKLNYINRQINDRQPTGRIMPIPNDKSCGYQEIFP